MKTDKKSIIAFICVLLSCILVIGVTIGLLSSASNTPAMGTADTASTKTDNKTDNAEEPPAEEPQPEPELEWGYKFKIVRDSAVDGLFDGRIAYKSQKSSFNLDDVTLNVSFGSMWNEADEFIDIPEFEIYFVKNCKNNKDYTSYLYKSVKEQFCSEKYAIAVIEAESDEWDYSYEFKHSEEITIPKELFIESEGTIKIVISGENVAINKCGGGILGEAAFKYQLIGDSEVVLSPM